MSLISDALKKARQEAARQDAAQRGLPYAVGGSEPAKRGSGLAGPLVAGLAAGAVLVGAGALAAYFGHWGPWKEPGAERLAQVQEAAPPPAAAPSPPAVPVPVPSAGPAAGPAEGTIGTTSSLPPAAAPPVQAQPAPREESRLAPPVIAPTPPAPRLAPPPAAAPVPSAPPAKSSQTQAIPPRVAPPADSGASGEGTAEGEERVYSGEVPVPGGGTLKLSGIAFSDNPVAVIDGKIVGRGEIIQGFTVVEIQRGRVRLQGHGQSVVVAVR